MWAFGVCSRLGGGDALYFCVCTCLPAVYGKDHVSVCMSAVVCIRTNDHARTHIHAISVSITTAPFCSRTPPPAATRPSRPPPVRAIVKCIIYIYMHLPTTRMERHRHVGDGRADRHAPAAGGGGLGRGHAAEEGDRRGQEAGGAGGALRVMYSFMCVFGCDVWITVSGCGVSLCVRVGGLGNRRSV